MCSTFVILQEYYRPLSGTYRFLDQWSANLPLSGLWKGPAGGTVSAHCGADGQGWPLEAWRGNRGWQRRQTCCWGESRGTTAICSDADASNPISQIRTGSLQEFPVHSLFRPPFLSFEFALTSGIALPSEDPRPKGVRDSLFFSLINKEYFVIRRCG
jgi:hypothetical protein